MNNQRRIAATEDQVRRVLAGPDVPSGREIQAAIKEIELRLRKARSGMILDTQWRLMAGLVVGLKTVVAYDVPTAGTNGKTIYYNPDFVMSLSGPEVLFLIGHEVLHVVLEHTNPARHEGKDKRIYNIACDIVINYILVHDLHMTMPDTGVFDADMYQKGEGNADKIYHLLMQQAPPPPPRGKPGDTDGPTGGGGIPDEDGDDTEVGSGQGEVDTDEDLFDDCTINPLSEEEAHEAQVEVREALISAKKSANFGDLPGSLQRAINETDKPKIHWLDRLNQYMQKARTERDWSRPSRRFASQGIYLPSRGGEEMGVVVIGLDVSGSIGREELAIRAHEINSVVEQFSPVKLAMLAHDTLVRDTREFDRGDDPNFENLKGGGGTKFDDFLEKADAYQPEVIIALTDLYGPLKTLVAPEAPIIWVSTGGTEAPFGDVVKITY